MINLHCTTILSQEIEEYDVFSIVYEPIHGIIYTNSKKEKRVMRPSEIHKFCDATLRRTLEGLKSYYNDVKYGYVQKELTNDEVEFLKLFVEEISSIDYRDSNEKVGMYVMEDTWPRMGKFQNNRPFGGDCRKSICLRDKQNLMVFEILRLMLVCAVFSTWMVFGGNTLTLGSLEKNSDKDYGTLPPESLEELCLTVRCKRRRSQA
ncbi:hypothetical protein Tco_0626767 [Tanacetum coccineum]|uniref:Uncharacterized protein n=1 Tax=Tanacetum coccineum TaxID=301880 RepID=A0ABQ4WKJ3_9ASTR